MGPPGGGGDAWLVYKGALYINYLPHIRDNFAKDIDKNIADANARWIDFWGDLKAGPFATRSEPHAHSASTRLTTRLCSQVQHGLSRRDVEDAPVRHLPTVHPGHLARARAVALAARPVAARSVAGAAERRVQGGDHEGLPEGDHAGGAVPRVRALPRGSPATRLHASRLPLAATSLPPHVSSRQDDLKPICGKATGRAVEQFCESQAKNTTDLVVRHAAAMLREARATA